MPVAFLMLIVDKHTDVNRVTFLVRCQNFAVEDFALVGSLDRLVFFYTDRRWHATTGVDVFHKATDQKWIAFLDDISGLDQDFRNCTSEIRVGSAELGDARFELGLILTASSSQPKT